MKPSLALVLMSLISLGTGCTSYPKALEMEKRSSYGPTKVSPAVARKQQRVEEVYVGRRLLASGDLFLGGRLLLVVSEPGSIFDKAKGSVR